MSNEPDELFTLRTLYWLGNFQAAINEANALTKINSILRAEKDEYIYRCYLGLNQYHIILSEIADNTNTSVNLLAIRLIATYLDNPNTKDTALLQMKEWLSDSNIIKNKTLQIMAATLFMYDGNFKDAIKTISGCVNMEQNAMLIQLYLRIDRLDLAQKQLKTMKSIDEDNILSQLATAWVNISSGGSKIQDASFIYEELSDKYGSSVLLLNGLAVSKMHQGQWEEAEQLLKEAITKSPSDPDTLANMITVCYHLQRQQDVINRYISQLKAKAPNHALITSLATFHAAFDRVASSIA